MAIKAAVKETEISVLAVTKNEIKFCILGNTPLILNRLSEKAKRELLMPKGKKNAAERASTLKHQPLQEYRSSPYKNSDPNHPTLLMLPAGAFKGSLKSAALDLPGASKSQIGRLTYIAGDNVDIYGVPMLLMSIVRSSDMNRTPDVRTRAILPEWACMLTVSFVEPMLRKQSVANLLAAAGISIGVGDFRPEKGSGNYGQFSICDATNKDFLRIMNQGRADQEKAMAEPQAYDDETGELLTWFESESKTRGFRLAA